MQVALTGTQIYWTVEVSAAFCRLEEGYENSIRDYYRKQVHQLNSLISLLVGELTKQQRQKIMTVCTIDVHARDVVSRLISQKVDSGSAFAWQSQLRHRLVKNLFIVIHLLLLRRLLLFLPFICLLDCLTQKFIIFDQS